MAKRNPNDVMKAYEDTILDAMARCLWVNAYASWVDELNIEFDLERPGPGGDWSDFAPETPPAAKKAAKDLVKLYVAGEKLEGVEYPMAELFGHAIEADTGKPYEFTDLLGRGAAEALPGEFGWGIASPALGNGTSWFDNHKHFELARVDFECSYDGDELIWSGGSAAAPREEAAVQGTRFLILVVDGDARDSYAVRYYGNTDEAIEHAIDLAIPDDGSSLEYGIVGARDAGAARLMAARTTLRPVPGRGPVRRNPQMEDNPRGKSQWGFDLVDFKSKGFQRVLKGLDIPVTDGCTKRLESSYNIFIWTGNDVRIVTSNNPITGEYSVPSRRPNEKDFAGYMGIEGTKRAVGRAVALIHRNARVIKDDKGSRGLRFIDFGDDDAEVNRNREVRANPCGNPPIKPGDVVFLPDGSKATVEKIDGGDAHVIEWNKKVGRGPWIFPVADLKHASHGRPPGVPNPSGREAGTGDYVLVGPDPDDTGGSHRVLMGERVRVVSTGEQGAIVRRRVGSRQDDVVKVRGDAGQVIAARAHDVIPVGVPNPFIGWNAAGKGIYGPDTRVQPKDAARLEPMRGYSQVLAAFDADGRAIGWVLVEDTGYTNAAEWMKANWKG